MACAQNTNFALYEKYRTDTYQALRINQSERESMSRPSTLTFELVAATAEAIQASGNTPSNRAVLERLGTGSMGTISRFMLAWREQRARPAAQEVSLPPALHRALVEYGVQAAAEARSNAEMELAAARQSESDLIGENERQAEELDSLVTELKQCQSANAEVEGRAAQLAMDLDASRSEVSRERAATETARVALAKAELRLEAVPRLEAELAECRAALDAERKARTDAERDAAVAKEKALGLTARLEDAQERLASGLTA